MTDITPEILKALEADGEKLRQMTGEDHGPFDLADRHGLSKDEWSAGLDAYHEKLRTSEGIEGYGPGSLVEQTGWNAWAGYFSDGYTPEEALDEDRSYWED